MALDWSALRSPAPASLVQAREIAHWAAQPVTQAARANLPAAEDDSHSALAWDAGLQALVSLPLPGGVRAGLRVATLEYLLGEERGATAQWLDEALKKRRLKPASGVRIPYDIPEKAPKSDPGLAALARWLDASGDALEQARAKYRGSPVRVWPHHFDMATLVEPGSGKSIGIGISPGDHYYAQPYLYVSPYPHPEDPSPPALPAPGRWHTHEFFAAVATADELLAGRDPRGALMAVIDAAVAAGKRWLDG